VQLVLYCRPEKESRRSIEVSFFLGPSLVTCHTFEPSSKPCSLQSLQVAVETYKKLLVRQGYFYYHQVFVRRLGECSGTGRMKQLSLGSESDILSDMF
jgi:hypothetical protein